MTLRTDWEERKRLLNEQLAAHDKRRGQFWKGVGNIGDWVQDEVIGIPSLQTRINVANRIDAANANREIPDGIVPQTNKPFVEGNANSIALENLTKVQPEEVTVTKNEGKGPETGATVNTEIPTYTRFEEAGRRQASGKGSVAKSKALLKKWKIDRAQQNQESSAIDDNGDPVASVNNPSGNNTTKLSYTPTAEQMKIKENQQILEGMSDPRTARARVEAFNSGNLKAIPNEIMNQPIPNYNKGAIQGFDTLNKTQMNEFKKLTSGGGGPFSSAAQTSKTLGGISNILGLVAKAQKKKENPSPSTGTGSPGSFQIPAVTVNPEDFYNMA